MAVTQTDLDALDKAFASGTLEVEFDGAGSVSRPLHP
jgi:hypothetical protein